MKPYFHYVDNKLQVEDVKISDLPYKTPYYCHSLSALKDSYKTFDDAAKTLRRDYLICYAVKSNFAPPIVKTFSEMGSGVDITSGGELYLAKKCGIDPKKIVFSGVGKTVEEIEQAISDDVLQINIESESEADIIMVRAMAMGKKPNVAVRINPDVDAMTHKKISTGQKENKFGVNLKQALAIYKKLKASEAVNISGIALHIGSQLLSVEPFENAFRRAANFISTLAENEIEIDNIDIGGGVGIQYANLDDGYNNRAILIAEYMDIVKKSFHGIGKKIIFEPGRFLTGNASCLVTKVIHLKINLEKRFIIIDAGMNNLIRPALYNAWHEILNVVKDHENKEFAFDIVGPVCESSDVFASQRKLETPKQNDLLAIMSVGAYGSSMSCNYNFRPILGEIMIDQSNVVEIRKPQTYEDIISSYI